MSQIKWRWSFNVKFCWILWSILWTWCCMCTQENADYKTCGCCDCLNVWSISFKGHLLKKTCFWNTLKLIYFLHIISLYIIFNRGLSIHFTFNVTWRKLIKTFFFSFLIIKPLIVTNSPVYRCLILNLQQFITAVVFVMVLFRSILMMLTEMSLCFFRFTNWTIESMMAGGHVYY